MEFDISEFRGKNAVCPPGASLRPGRYKSRLVIRDFDTGEAAVAKAYAPVAKPSERSLILGQSLLLVPESGFVYLWEQMQEKKSRQIWNDVCSFDSRLSTPLIGPLPKGASKISALIPYRQASLSGGDIVFKAHLVNFSSRQNIPVACAQLERISKEGFQVQLLGLELGGLQTGEYVLYILAQDSSKKQTSYVHTTLLVR